MSQSQSTQPAKTLSGKHYPVLDGVRGVAILLVLWFHSVGLFDQSNLLETYWCSVSTGMWCGVDLFFVLSGFLITGILLDTLESRRYFFNFFMRRVLRIFPLYYGFLALVFVGFPYFDGRIWFWFYLQNWFPIYDWPTVHRALWSLAVEEQFYLVWPFIVFFVPRRALGKLCVTVILLVAVVRTGLIVSGYNPWLIYTMTCFRIDTLLTGALLAVIVRSDSTREKLKRLVPALAGVAILGLLCVFIADGGFPIDGPYVQSIGYTFFATGFGLCIFVALDAPGRLKPIAGLLESKALRYMGNRSYAIYIFHFPVLLAAELYYDSKWQAADHSGYADWIALALGLLVVLFFAECSWHCYEKQFLKLKRFFPRSIEPTHAEREAPPTLSVETSAVASELD